MTGAILFTVLLFVVACVMCVAINYAVVKFWWDGVAQWVRHTTIIVFTAAIFFGVYCITYYLWGADTFSSGVQLK